MTIRVLVTPKEKRNLEAHVRRCGQTLSDWLRMTALEAMNGGKKPGTPKDARPGDQAVSVLSRGRTA